MRSFAASVRFLSNACALAAAVLISAAMLVICYMIVRRALGYSSWWEIEAAIYMTVAAMFLASPYTLRSGGHVSVDLVPGLLKGQARLLFVRALQVVGFLVCVYLAWEGMHLTYEAIEADERSISLWRPVRWPMFAMMPLGMGLTALQYLADILDPPSELPALSKPPHTEST